MKKIILFLALFIITFYVSLAQSNEVYIVFTPVEGNIINPNTGIVYKKQTYNSGEVSYKYRFSNKSFEVRVVGIVDYSFTNYDYYDQRKFSVETKPKSFLNTIEYLDWDVIAPKLTEQEAKKLYREIGDKKSVYFINRNEMTGDSIKVVETALFVPRA